jgi:hypothetical protein
MIDLKPYLNFSSVFIETGSAIGDGIQRALNAGFLKVKSVELHPEKFDHCKERFKEDPRVELFFGKSYEQLPKMIEDRCVCFLDAHPSGPGTAGHYRLMEEGSGSEFDQDTIIKKELSIILKGVHLVIIDDCQGENELTLYYKSLMPGYKFRFLDDEGHKEKILVCEP